MIISVHGLNAEPWEPSRGSIARRNGKLYVQMSKPSKMREFQTTLANILEPCGPPPALEEGECIAMAILVWRRLELSQRATGRAHRGHRTDATNLQKSIEDACQGILFGNDRDNLDVRTLLMRQDQDTQPLIVIHVNVIPIDSLHFVGSDRAPDFEFDVTDGWAGNDVAVTRDVPDDLF